MAVTENNLQFHCAWHWEHWSPGSPGSCSDIWSLFHSPSYPSRWKDQPGNHGNSGWIYDGHLIKKEFLLQMKKLNWSVLFLYNIPGLRLSQEGERVAALIVLIASYELINTL